MAKKILIAGASGLIGARLTDVLLQRGKEVAHLGRTKKAGKIPSFVWNVESGIMDPEALSEVNCIINLAGAGVADKRWTQWRKKEILQSRMQSTALLHKELNKGKHNVQSFISASAIGYYGLDTGKSLVTEESSPGKDFLAEVVKLWEEEVEKVRSPGIRVVKLRTGIVLSEKGGALRSMATPIKWGFGAALGNGRQMLSWIHIDDLCDMYLRAAEDDSMTGAYNAVGDQPVTNAELTRAIAKILNRPLWLPAVPEAVLKLIFGELANMVIGGCNASPEKIRKTGFQFQFTDLEVALRNLFQV